MSAVPSMNADNFVQSVLINLDPLNHKDPQLRHQALEYFNNVKNSNDGWKMCVQLLHTFVVNKGKDEIKHSCLEVIYQGVESGRIAVTASESDKSALRSSLMLLTRDSISSIPQSKLIKTKLATVFVSLVKHDFPGSWPSFFHDFISIITQTGYNPEVLEVFLRVLKAIDEDIITGDSNSRSKEEKDRIMVIKDAMRASCVGPIVDLLYNVLYTYGGNILEENAAVGRSPRGVDSSGSVDNSTVGIVNASTLSRSQKDHLCQLALEVLEEYIEWIEIDLVVNDRMISLFYKFVTTSPEVSFAANVINCLHEIVLKRMSSAKKFFLIRQLGLFNQLRLVNPVTCSEGVLAALAALINAYGVILMDCFKSFKNSPEDALNVSPRSNPRPPTPLTPAPLDVPASGGHGTKPNSLLSPLSYVNGGNSNSPLQSSAAGGVALSGSKSPDLLAQCKEAEQYLDQCMHLVYSFFTTIDWKAQSEMVELLSNFVQVLKSEDKQHAAGALALSANASFAPSPSSFSAVSPTGGSSASASNLSDKTVRSSHLSMLIKAVVVAMQFPNQYAWDSKEDDEIEFDRFRGTLSNIFRQICSVSPELTFFFVNSMLAETISNQGLAQASFALVEVSLHVLSLFADIRRDFTKQINGEAWNRLLDFVFTSAVSEHPHPVVPIAYFDVVVRYCRFFDEGPHAGRVSMVLVTFLDQRGIGHAHPSVRTKAIGQLLRFVKSLTEANKKALSGMTNDILTLLDTVVSSVLPRGMTRSKGLVPFDDCLFLCELLGIICSSAMCGDKFREYFMVVARFILGPLEQAVAKKEEWFKTDKELAAKRVSQLIVAAGMLCKSFSADSAGIMDFYTKTTEMVLQLFFVAPDHEKVRAKTMVFVHTITEVLREPVVQFVGPLLDTLLKHVESDELLAFFQLVNNIIVRLKDKVGNILDVLYGPILMKVSDAIQACNIEIETATKVMVPAIRAGNGATGGMGGVLGLEADGGNLSPRGAGSSSNSTAKDALQSQHQAAAAACSAQRVKKNEILKIFFTYLRDLLTNDLSALFFSERNISTHLKDTMGAIMASIMESNIEITIPRSCFGLLRLFVTRFHTRAKESGRDMDPSLVKFFVQDCTSAVFQFALAPHVKIRDAATLTALKEASMYLKALAQLFSQSYALFLMEFMTGQICAPQPMALSFVTACVSGLQDQFFVMFRELIDQKRQSMSI